MSVEEHRSRGGDPVGFSVVTVSDTRSRETDPSGDLICRRLEEAGHRIVERSLIRDDHLEIESAIIRGMQRPEVQVVIFTGGTGISARDITPEVVEEHLDKALDGFGELFRALSYEVIGPAAMLSRALCGIAERKVLICVPGAPAAVELALERLILPEIGHLVHEATR